MNSLKQLCAKYKKGDWPDRDTTHSYIDVYEEILEPYRHTAKKILEIGLMSGESLRMWSEYFSGKVYGMDCSETPIDGLADLRPIMAEGKFNIRIGDATNANDIQKHFSDIGFDVIIDDGSHEINSQITTFKLLRDKLTMGGIYIVEDLQNIDKDCDLFWKLGNGLSLEVIDRRKIKGRYDDVLLIIKKLIA